MHASTMPPGGNLIYSQTCSQTYHGLKLKSLTYNKQVHCHRQKVLMSAKEACLKAQPRAGLAEMAAMLESQYAGYSETDADLGYSTTSAGLATTGLPMIVFIGLEEPEHCCRLLVSRKYGNKVKIGDWFTITISEEPCVIGDTGSISMQDIKLVIRFVHRNMATLSNCWYQTKCMGSLDLLSQLERV